MTHAHWDCSHGATTSTMLGACLDVLGDDGKQRVKDDLEKLFGEFSLDRKISLHTEHIATSSWGNAVVVVLPIIDEHVVLSSEEIYGVLSKAGPDTAGMLPDVIALLQDAELSVSDYTTSFTLKLQQLVEISAILLIREYLNIKTDSCSALPLGEGSFEHQDGVILPIPSPATLRLLLGMKTCPGPISSGVTGELVTSAACAVIKRIAAQGGTHQSLPVGFVPERVGVGGSTSKTATWPVRLILGTSVHESSSPSLSNHPNNNISAPLWKTDSLTHLEANLDDTTAEALAFAMDVLLQNGAVVDVWVAPIVMKKGRAAHTLHCLCQSSSSTTVVVDKLVTIMFQQTTTLGIRIHRNVERAALRRSFVTVQTEFVDESSKRQGKVNVKIGSLGDDIVSVKPEFEHCKEISLSTGVPLKRISDSAIQAFYKSELDDS